MVAGLRRGAATRLDDVAATVLRLVPWWFVMRNAHASDGARLLNRRTTMSLLRGPMTRDEIAGRGRWGAARRRPRGEDGGAVVPARWPARRAREQIYGL
jgi:hypothetical protein